MSITKHRLLSIPEFRTAFPHISENQLRWSLRHRRENGLGRYVFRRVRNGCLLIDERAGTRWFNRVVPA